MIRVFTFWILISHVLCSLDAAPLKTDDGFEVPQPGRTFVFPADHASHPSFKIEWWYVTGHLRDAEGGQYGFQATFFRRAFKPDETEVRQFFLAHMALTDIARGTFLHQERLARDTWEGSASPDDLKLRNGPWTLERETTASGGDRFLLKGGVKAEARWEFAMTPAKPLVVFGTEGVSRKGSDPTAASHYLTFTRLSVEGTLLQGSASKSVTGEAWMDHEFSSSQLSTGQVGWDWAGIQLTDGRELMVYRLRLEDGTQDPASKLSWVDQEGKVTERAFSWRAKENWTSPETKITYPAQIELSTTDPASAKPLTLLLKPVLANQELVGSRGGVTYWEGACLVTDDQGKLLGRAYVELTGYNGKVRM